MLNPIKVGDPVPRRALFVLPRLGPVGSGAETLLSAMARRLAGQYGWRVEIATTCCLDEVTWQNELPEGVSNEHGIVVHRFPVRTPLRLVPSLFRQSVRHRSGRWLLDTLGCLPPKPRSPALRGFLKGKLPTVDLVVAGPYIQGSSMDAADAASGKLVLFPCLHDEPEASLQAVGRMLRAASRVCFNSEPELQLARRLHGQEIDGAVVGIGIDPPALVASEEDVRQRFGIRKDYLCFIGRCTPGKGIDRMVSAVLMHNRLRPDAAVDLIIAGNGRAVFPDSPGVRHIGYVDEATKHGLLSAALATVSFSRMESLSILLLESWSVGTPVVVHADADVLEWQVRRSGGGLAIQTAEEFSAAIDRLRQPTERTRLGQAGARLVQIEYAWERVLERFSRSLPPLLSGAG